MGVVVNVDDVFGFETYIEAAPNACEGLESIAQLVFVQSAAECYGCCCHGVFDVVEAGVLKLDVVKHLVRGAQVEKDVAVVVAHIDGVVVGLYRPCRIGVMLYLFADLQMVLVFFVFLLLVVMVAVFGQAFLEEQSTFGVGLVGVLLEGGNQVLVSAVDVQMVGVGGGYDRIVGVQLQERAVVFVSFHDHVLAVVVHNQVAVEVFGDAAKKSAASDVCFAEQIGYHSRCCRFAVRAGHADAFFAACQFAQHLRAFLHWVTQRFQVLVFARVRRDGGRVYHQVYILRNQFRIVFVVYGNTFAFKLLCERALGAVVSAHVVSAKLEVARQCAHSYSTYA